MLYAEVILPLPLPGVFTYSVPAPLASAVTPGKRVLVRLGRKKIYAGIVTRIHNVKPEGYATKDILSIPDASPVVLPVQLDFWTWLAGYYMCAPGEVMKAAMPAGFRPGGAKTATQVQHTGDAAGTGDQELLPEKWLRDRSVLKTEPFISLHPSACGRKAINEIADRLTRAPRQLELLYHYLSETGYDGSAGPAPEIARGRLSASPLFSMAALKALVSKNIFRVFDREVPGIDGNGQQPGTMSTLNVFQQQALESIKDQFGSRDVVLLNGITSGGKTEIYIHLINRELKEGRQVLYLLPEIALTAQIIIRLNNIFSRKAGIYHSKLSDSERIEIWNNVMGNGDGGYGLILGVRSSLFLPFSRLGLVIVDEEHENTFKQFDPAPRYHARDAAIMLASMHGAKTLLGTATPSVESAFNARTGKYGQVNLLKRYLEIELPEIIIADTRRARKMKKMRSIFTPQLFECMGQALTKGEQVILFQNRRGYALFLECADCGWISFCRHCDVSMTYHKHSGRMVCHYCSDNREPPDGCPDCGSTDIKTRGYGTERIEDEIRLFFPEARVGRLDLDAVKKKKAHEKIIGDFESGSLDILVGTQMIAKGLDFSGVSLVGILNADHLLFFPDFRAHERSFQLISQVSGRAGRKAGRGKVVIQTGFPDHPVIRHVLKNDPDGHLDSQLAERRQFLYPPYVRLIRIIVRNRNRDIVEKAAASLAVGLKKRFGSRVLGPEYPLIGRIQNNYIMNILIKLEKGANLSRAKHLIRMEISALQSVPGMASCQVHPDVDPV
jgi:primosomal protein N' (replication factor Y) (superfamily II helicase)